MKNQSPSAIEQIESQIEKITKVIFGLLDREPAMNGQFDVIITMPGIGKIVAVTLLVDCPELSKISAEKVAVLAGVVPFADDSGAKSGKLSIFGGRAVVRSALFVAAMIVTKMKLPNIRVLQQQNLCLYFKLNNTKSLTPT